MLGFVFEIVLNSGLTDEQRIIILKLELLNQKLKVLSGDMKKNLLPTEETFLVFDTMEESLGKELKGMIEELREMAWRLPEKETSLGGGSPGTAKNVIASPRGESSGAKGKKLRFLQIEEERSIEWEKPKEDEQCTLMFDARSVGDCVWFCGCSRKEDDLRSGSGVRWRRTLDRGGIG